MKKKPDYQPLDLKIRRIHTGVKAGPIRMVDDPHPYVRTCDIPCMGSSQRYCYTTAQ